MGNVCCCRCSEEDANDRSTSQPRQGYDTFSRNSTQHSRRTIVNQPTNNSSTRSRNSREVIIPTVLVLPNSSDTVRSQASTRSVVAPTSIVENSRYTEPSSHVREARPRTSYQNQSSNRNLNPKQHEVITKFQNLIISDTPVPLKKVTENREILRSLFRASSITHNGNIRNADRVYDLERLDSNSLEYQGVSRLFFQTNKRCFHIHSIEKVNNPYLMLQYELKKNEYVERGKSYEEKIMFHGTKKSNVDDICQTNFNWRLRGTSRGHIFGQGVSFSPIANYATHYGDNGYNKVMLAVNVLIGNTCLGRRDLIIPASGYDTSTNEKKHVYVKYEDNTFYPAYLIHYGGIDEQNNENKNGNNANREEQLNTFTATLFGDVNNGGNDPGAFLRSKFNVAKTMPNVYSVQLPGLRDLGLERRRFHQQHLGTERQPNFRPNFNRHLQVRVPGMQNSGVPRLSNLGVPRLSNPGFQRLSNPGFKRHRHNVNHLRQGWQML